MIMVSGKQNVCAPFLNSVSHSSVKRKGDPTCFIISPLMVSFTLSLFLLTEVRCLIPVTLLLRGLNFLPLCFCGVTKLNSFGVSPNLNLMIYPIPLAVPGYSCLCVRSCECCFHISDSELVLLSVLHQAGFTLYSSWLESSV